METQNIGEWEAWIFPQDLKPHIHVKGTIPTNGEEPIFRLTPAVPQGIVENQLILELAPDVIDPEGNQIAHVEEFSQFAEFKSYDTVLIRTASISHVATIKVVEKDRSSNTLIGDTTTKLFEGQSRQGDFTEALQNALDAARDELPTEIVQWTLDKVSGEFGGFTGGKFLTVSIEAGPHQGSENFLKALVPESGSTQQAQVPIRLSGVVAKITGVSICMDGATHSLGIGEGIEMRLKASNEEVKKFLDEVSGKRFLVEVTGYRVLGPECSHIRVFHAQPLRDAFEKLNFNGGDFFQVLGGELPRGI